MTDTVDFPDPSFGDRPNPVGWLDAHRMDEVRSLLPLVYVDAVPVRVDESGDVIQVGLLLRATESGHMMRALVSGRVMYHERVRDALVRHIEKDLGPVALPSIPASPQPFTVAEYFPTPGVTPFYDDRHHAVSLAYIVPVRGDCSPQQNNLELTWLTPEEACSPRILAHMQGGQDMLLKQALAHAGRLPDLS
ncbi:NUDIX hydrolase family protein [Jonesia denitrificans]|uniref:NUDIX hydrolase n=2 Tax=Jonesia denitrificans (strain ATCC 14870 / DSM 20603 / BCRC 15368 / CIP 55.134 / JCM 11481 / NBRC 15587 / NCTC 10816 / Prevot 55134) TaxID=471856 RepID=C7R2I1_JONDD|nr:hypothetical protein Jden_0890 [Jonesia denitrificans DSM 20603]ASE07818.1 DUF4916 domain-containing protein [Jonesia denitrificans]QXB42429.1 NUDIX hydrolase family protein [Jonesia denitrificans]SQH20536.1 Uncharacterised protein [Jonesia denitrificans]